MNQQALIEKQTGRKFQKSSTPAMIDFSKPVGEEAYSAPESMHWRIFKNNIALAIGGVTAVLLEFADARIRSGVWDHSVYPVDPIGRSQRTGMAAMVGVYGPKSVARRVIGGVNRMHAKVSGGNAEGRSLYGAGPGLAQLGLCDSAVRIPHRL